MRTALLVGIESCPAADLRGPAADVALVRAVVCERFGLLARTLPNRAATRDGVLAALDELVSAARERDRLLFYFAGHGTQVADAAEGLDENGAVDYHEAICPHDFSRDDPSRAIRDTELHQLFAKAIARGAGITAIFDCCFAGGLAARDVVRGPINAGDEGVRARSLATLEGRWSEAVPSGVLRRVHRMTDVPRTRDGGASPVVFGACLAGSLARECRYDTEIRGEFTHHLAAVLATAAPGITNVAVRDAVRASIAASDPSNRSPSRPVFAPASADQAVFLD